MAPRPPEPHGHDPYEAESDVGEVLAHCQRCGEARTFRRENVDLSDVEAASASPSVRRAIEGEPVWVCSVCGHFRRDPIEASAYPVAFSNVGAIRAEPGDQAPRSKAITEDLEAVMDTGGEAIALEPATEEDALHEVPSQLAAPGERPPDADDAVVRRLTLREAREVEAGERDLSLEHGPRRARELPPPERLPRRDPTDEE